MNDKELNRSQYLQALGLFNLAVNSCAKTDEYLREIKRLLHKDNSMDHIDDAVYGNKDFDDTLERMGYKLV